MVSGSRYPAFHAFLADQRPLIVDAIIQDIIALFREPVASLSHQDLTAQVDATIGHYLDTLAQGDHQSLLEWVLERLVLRTRAGATLEQVLQIVTTYHQHLLSAALQAVARQVDAAHDGTLALMALCNLVITTIGTSYQQQMQHANSELRTFKELVDNAQDGISLVSPEHTLIYTNPAYERLSGFGVESSIAEQYHPDYYTTYITNHVIPTVQKKGAWSGLQQLQRPDGEEWTAQVSNVLLTDSSGRATAIGTILRDVSEQQDQEQTLRTFQTLVEHAPDGIVLATIDGTITYANAAFYDISGYEEDALGMPLAHLHTKAEQQHASALFPQLLTEGIWQDVMQCQRKDGSTFAAHVTSFLIYDNDGQTQGQAAMLRDISEQQHAEQERLNLREAIIETQRDALRKLGTPLLPLSDNLIALPLVGTIDSLRAQQVMEALLEGIATYQAHQAIIDITGVDVVDTQVAQALIRTAQAVKLLGAQIILSGIQPQIAQTLVHLGVDLSDIVTCRTLQDGIAYALNTT